MLEQLGPLLFLIYVDDITRVSLSEGTKLVLYADDMLLYRKIDHPEDYVALQLDINSVNNWIKGNYLTFNASKCKYMLISRDVCTLQTRHLEHKLCTMFKTVHNLISFPPILVPRHSRIGYNAYLQPFAHTNSFLYSFVPTLFHCGIHYLVVSLAHLHLLFLKHIYISILRVCNQDTPYILAYATVVSIALEHKLFCRKKKKVKIFFRASHGRIGATRLHALSVSMH